MISTVTDSRPRRQTAPEDPPARRRRLGRLVGLPTACAIVCLIGVAPASAAGGLRSITVDASAPVGMLRSLQGVSGTPLPGDGSHPDFTSQFQQLGVDIVRTHDVDCSGTSDIDGLGPNRIFPNWNANPNDPASYNFGPTDTAVLSIVHSGAQVEYSIGHSDLSCAGVGFNNTPPPDPALYAIVARHVAEHYNDGWDNGYRLHIRYWEIWNEPDLFPFWSGTSAQFYALFADTARALKSLHPWMQVGGPALTTNNDLTGYRQSLLSYVRDNHVPLDFYSIHHYSDFTEDPLDYVRLADEDRRLLDRYGFSHTQIQLTEWNYGLVDTPTPMQRAAFAADSLIYMQGCAPAAGLLLPIRRHERLRPHQPRRNAHQAGRCLCRGGEPERHPRAPGDHRRRPERTRRGRRVGRGERRADIRVLISNYEIPAADQGPFPPFIVDNRFTIPGIGTFTLLPRRSVTYADNGGYDLSINHIRGGKSGLVVSRYRVDEVTT